jgi:hypothetical protein
VDGRGSIISNPTTTLMMNATTARERARRENLTMDTAFATDPSNSFQEVEIPLKSGSNQAIHEMQKVIAKEFIKVHDWFEELEHSLHDFQDERQAVEIRQLKAACSLPDPAAAKTRPYPDQENSIYLFHRNPRERKDTTHRRGPRLEELLFRVTFSPFLVQIPSRRSESQ